MTKEEAETYIEMSKGLIKLQKKEKALKCAKIAVSLLNNEINKNENNEQEL